MEQRSLLFLGFESSIDKSRPFRGLVLYLEEKISK